MHKVEPRFCYFDADYPQIILIPKLRVSAIQLYSDFNSNTNFFSRATILREILPRFHQ